ncbi:type II secretion system F family protein [Parvularcula dongshanensis]|uniref:Tight adherence protein B n=1 Tax=Parvularcula dongshanensis TaxID=1173995 RepID=A0A840I0D2_9PROT|nr:type II secretion system F family protein [Parvularcula dongshanensis]MBB4657733.1 tight adherence protein B [Parvularcula dongshanensis]
MDQQTLIIGAGLLVAFGILAFVLLAPSENDKAKKRANMVTGTGRQTKKSAQGGQDASKERRKHVADSLRKIEEAAAAEKKKRVGLEAMIAQAGLDLTVRNFYMISAVVGLVFAAIGIITGQKPWVIGAMLIVGGLGFPRWFIAKKRKTRQKKFVEEFSNAMDVITRGIKSGLPVNECLKIIARDAQEPVRTEFHLLTEGLRLGLSLEQSLDRMYKRMPVGEVNFFSIVLLIQQQTGGNLAEALSNLSNVLRSRKSMLGKIAALSMEAKASAAILGAMPFIVSTLVHLSSPEYLEPLFTTKFGNMLLLGAGLWMSCGVLVMKNMINIKV